METENTHALGTTPGAFSLFRFFFVSPFESFFFVSFSFFFFGFFFLKQKKKQNKKHPPTCRRRWPAPIFRPPDETRGETKKKNRKRKRKRKRKSKKQKGKSPLTHQSGGPPASLLAPTSKFSLPMHKNPVKPSKTQ